MPERFAQIVSTEQGLAASDLFEKTMHYSLEGIDLEPGTIIRYSVVEGNFTFSSVVACAGSALSAIWRVLAENGVNPLFPADVHREVEAIVKNPGINDTSLIELTHLPFVTIDNFDSRDLDQAMHITRIGSRFMLRYALADAVHFVRPGTALFKEALRRGASFYVPGFAIPMLPRALSEDLISLNESMLRRALVFTISFDEEGAVLSTGVKLARIKSIAKLSYKGVEQYYKGFDCPSFAKKPYIETLDCLRELGELLITRARDRNVVEYDRSTVEVRLTDDGQSLQLIDVERLQVEKYNEQISLICNTEGARLLSEAGLSPVVQAVFRVHEAPDEERLKKFSRLLKGLILNNRLNPKLWVWRWRDGRYGSRENLSDYLLRLRNNNVDNGMLTAVQRQALMLSTASHFSATPGEHHALKVDQYARFSSPMREIAGIFTHREYLQLVGLAKIDTDDLQLREEVISVANKAKEVQNKLNKAVMKKAIDQLFECELELPRERRQRFSGVVVSLRSTRIYVQLNEPKINVKIYLNKTGEYSGRPYQLDRSFAYVSVDGEVVFSLGQQLTLLVESYSEDRQRWHLMPV